MKPAHTNSNVLEPAYGPLRAMKVEIQFHAAFPIEFQIQRLEDLPLQKVLEPWPVPAALEEAASAATTVNLE